MLEDRVEFQRIPRNWWCPDKKRVQFDRGKLKVLQLGRKPPPHCVSTAGEQLVGEQQLWITS